MAVLFLHSTIVAATKTITVAAPVSTSSSYTAPSEFEKTMLSVHNMYRDQHNASALSWNTSLADFGNHWAEGCVWKHSGGPSGEDLAAGYANATAAVEAWGNERAQYNFAKQGFSEQTGHFTQVVWKGTKTVGCGRVKCDGKNKTPGWYVVCEYYPAGNVGGEYDQNVQSQIKGGSQHIQGAINSSAQLVPLMALNVAFIAIVAVLSSCF
ncbi:MAG: hypothetical protein M4579_004813 [Chaenotheca gracillima]|nr:MAG: hypothetical protein M4579_004813 [Chaenotheca gracillima]